MKLILLLILHCLMFHIFLATDRFTTGDSVYTSFCTNNKAIRSKFTEAILKPAEHLRWGFL